MTPFFELSHLAGLSKDQGNQCQTPGVKFEDETGRSGENEMRREETERKRKNLRKNTKNQKKLDDTERNRKKQEETERNRKKQEDTGRNRKKQEERVNKNQGCHFVPFRGI